MLRNKFNTYVVNAHISVGGISKWVSDELSHSHVNSSYDKPLYVRWCSNTTPHTIYYASTTATFTTSSLYMYCGRNIRLFTRVIVVNIVNMVYLIHVIPTSAVRASPPFVAQHVH